jgi:hypothetical protein
LGLKRFVFVYYKQRAQQPMSRIASTASLLDQQRVQQHKANIVEYDQRQRLDQGREQALQRCKFPDEFQVYARIARYNKSATPPGAEEYNAEEMIKLVRLAINLHSVDTPTLSLVKQLLDDFPNVQLDVFGYSCVAAAGQSKHQPIIDLIQQHRAWQSQQTVEETVQDTETAEQKQRKQRRDKRSLFVPAIGTLLQQDDESTLCWLVDQRIDALKQLLAAHDQLLALEGK